MTTSHLVMVSSLVSSSLLTRLRPLPHPPEVGGGDGETEVDVRVLVQSLQVLGCHRQYLHGLLLHHYELGSLPVEAVQGPPSTGWCGRGSDQRSQSPGAPRVSSRVQLLLRQASVSPGALCWLLRL